jgi:hypothetical protein
MRAVRNVLVAIPDYSHFTLNRRPKEIMHLTLVGCGDSAFPHPLPYPETPNFAHLIPHHQFLSRHHWSVQVLKLVL